MARKPQIKAVGGRASRVQWRSVPRPSIRVGRGARCTRALCLRRTWWRREITIEDGVQGDCLADISAIEPSRKVTPPDQIIKTLLRLLHKR